MLMSQVLKTKQSCMQKRELLPKMGQFSAVSFINLLFLLPVVTPTIATTSNLLHLSPGLHLSILQSYNSSSGSPFSRDLMFSVATPTLDGGGFFFPILSSPSFNTFPPINSTSSSMPNIGYSLGFYLKPQLGGSYIEPDNSDCDMTLGCKLYMAVCAGFLGIMNKLDNQRELVIQDGAEGTVSSLYPYVTVDGFAAPVWIANLDNPISSVSQVSLTVHRAADWVGSSANDAPKLQLREGDKVVWQQPCGDAIEMLDTGHLINVYIDNSTTRSHVVWQTTTDSLAPGQNVLAVGQELVSNDSSYVARMEKGGLVFYMNKTHFNREPQPPPYWVFPLHFQNVDSESLNQLVSSAACSSSSAYTKELMINQLVLLLDPGVCKTASPSFLQSSAVQFNNIRAQDGFYWLLVRLENDGMLYSYAVSSLRGFAASITRWSINSYGTGNSQESGWYTPLALRWQQCNVPMACGRLGVCTPGAKTLCSCPPEPDFIPVNSTDLSQGCKRSIDLPNCSSNGASGHTSPTDFVQLNSTASIWLFNEWTFNYTPGVEVDACKRSCSSDCSCNGFFYVQVNTSSCFFISDEISLMSVADTNYIPIRFSFSADRNNWTNMIYARDYITLLKVAASSVHAQINITSKNTRSRSRAAFYTLPAVIPSVLIVCLALGIAGYFFRARQQTYARTSNMLSREEANELQDILPLLPNRFSYRELFAATEGFAKLLGAGGCGSVYAGVLPDGRKVAVKVLQAVYLQGIRQSKQFLAELATIGHTNHHNIVRLVGFCWEAAQRLLVYEFVERGSLDRWIFAKQPAARAIHEATGSTAELLADAPLFLDWKTRYSVALGIARGLSYLHEECEQPILHFDIKPQNILLDNEFVAKLADFGMSRLIGRDMSAVVTGMRGTPGYIAPEWCQGTVSKKTDIYSMGMVLLEIVGGRKNLDLSLLANSTEEQEAWHFPTWAAGKCEQAQQLELVDTRLQACGFDAAQALRLIHVAFWCIQDNPAMRPNAPTVVQWLESSSAVEQPPFSAAVNTGKSTNISKLSSPFSRS